MFSLTRRSFLKSIVFLAGLVGVPLAAKPTAAESALPRLKFKKRKDGYIELLNVPEVMNGRPFEQRPHGLHHSWDGIIFKWQRVCHAWINKKDALLLDPSICWGEIILIEETKFSSTRNSAHVHFIIKRFQKTRRIKFPRYFPFSTNKDEIRHEIEQAFADTVGARPSLPIDQYIGPEEKVVPV